MQKLKRGDRRQNLVADGLQRAARREPDDELVQRSHVGELSGKLVLEGHNLADPSWRRLGD